MVNVQQYNIVETGQTVAQCEENYRKTLLNNGIIDSTDAEVPAEEQELWEKKGTIAEIRSAVIEGTSVYYLRFEGESAFSVYVSAAQVPEAPLLNVGIPSLFTGRAARSGSQHGESKWKTGPLPPRRRNRKRKPAPENRGQTARSFLTKTAASSRRILRERYKRGKCGRHCACRIFLLSELSNFLIKFWLRTLTFLIVNVHTVWYR